MNDLEETYFFDTYAFLEIINGNSNYAKYRDVGIVTTVFNIAELNYNLKKEMDKSSADGISQKYWGSVVEILFEDLIKAMDLKIKHRDLSIPDVIGYVVAERLGVKFLTGDQGFEDFDNVAYVKK
tara:strand:- start:261 stop:635 length:375 start_codon:yes stop_codon:yes gene_type:complete